MSRVTVDLRRLAGTGPCADAIACLMAVTDLLRAFASVCVSVHEGH